MTEKELICVNCPMGCRVTVTMEDGKILDVKGNSCPRGRAYAEKECIRPERILTTTVKIQNGTHPVLPVITDKEIPLDMIFEAMEEVRSVTVEAQTVLIEKTALFFLRQKRQKIVEFNFSKFFEKKYKRRLQRCLLFAIIGEH